MPNAALQRRATERLDSEIEVDVHSETNFYTGFSQNIAEGGIFVATYQTHAVGDRLRVRIRLPGVDTPVDAKIEVRWLRSIQPGAAGVPGFGGAFVELTDATRETIERFVQHRGALFHDE